MGAPKIGLAETIVNLRQELLRAQQQAAGEDVRFAVENIEVELQMTTAKEAEGSGGVEFWVYNAKAGGKLKRESVHKLRLSLKPATGSGDSRGPLQISDTDERPQG